MVVEVVVIAEDAAARPVVAAVVAIKTVAGNTEEVASKVVEPTADRVFRAEADRLLVTAFKVVAARQIETRMLAMAEVRRTEVAEEVCLRQVAPRGGTAIRRPSAAGQIVAPIRRATEGRRTATVLRAVASLHRVAVVGRAAAVRRTVEVQRTEEAEVIAVQEVEEVRQTAVLRQIRAVHLAAVAGTRQIRARATGAEISVAAMATVLHAATDQPITDAAPTAPIETVATAATLQREVATIVEEMHAAVEVIVEAMLAAAETRTIVVAVAEITIAVAALLMRRAAVVHRGIVAVVMVADITDLIVTITATHTTTGITIGITGIGTTTGHIPGFTDPGVGTWAAVGALVGDLTWVP